MNSLILVTHAIRTLFRVAILLFMIRWSTQRRRIASTVLTAVLAGVLLVGTCVAAPVRCATPCPQSERSVDFTMPCEKATKSCDLPSLDTPPSVGLDFSLTPVLLSTLPAVTVTPVIHRVPPTHWQAVHAPPTPLYLQHLALLI
ncbi:MAG TPA: hypothetical protein VJS66_09595 [Burkholderiales bacterium]|nr:hypothetical protein [Burkholderiales bacterium]